MWPIVTVPLAVTLVGAPLFWKVAVPVGMVAGPQLAFSSHSLGSPALPPTHIASCACADTTPSAVPASRIARQRRAIARNPDRPNCSGQFGTFMHVLKRLVDK